MNNTITSRFKLHHVGLVCGNSRKVWRLIWEISVNSSLSLQWRTLSTSNRGLASQETGLQLPVSYTRFPFQLFYEHHTWYILFNCITANIIRYIFHAIVLEPIFKKIFFSYRFEPILNMGFSFHLFESQYYTWEFLFYCLTCCEHEQWNILTYSKWFCE